MTTFMATMPADKPKYLIMVLFRRAAGLEETHGFRTSGWNAAPVTAR